jgi:sulfur relay (sulfurtransferase) complex TusBCD TusD component (DsrE family)
MPGLELRLYPEGNSKPEMLRQPRSKQGAGNTDVHFRKSSESNVVVHVCNPCTPEEAGGL